MADPKVTARDGSTGQFLVRNPQTGNIEAYNEADAGRLLNVQGWLPVTQEEAQPYFRQKATAEATSTTEGLVLGGFRGGTGGLPELLLDPKSLEAEGVRTIEEGAPGAMLGGEIAGTIAPFLPGKAVKAVRLGTAPGLLDLAGETVTKGIRGAKSGFARQLLSRVAGVGVEGAGAVTLGEVRRAHINDDPLTAGRLMDAYALGAMLPAMVVGAPLGAAEGALATLSRRAVGRGGIVKQNVWKPGVSEKDVMDIAMREHGVAAPGLLNQFHAANAKSPLLDDPAFFAVLNDPGPAGQQLRREVFQESSQMRELAEQELAGRLNEGLEVDRFAATNWSGRLKAERVRQWIDDNLPADADIQAHLQELRQAGRLDDIAAEAARQVRRGTEAGKELATALGVDSRTAAEVVAMKLLEGDETTLRALSKIVKPADVKGNAWRNEALRAIDEYGELFATMRERGKGHIGDQPGKVDRALELLSQVRRDIENAPRSTGYTELDWLKKRLADYAKPDQYLGAGDDVARNARNAHETFRQMLEDPTLWGERAAMAQRDMNAIFHKRMARKDAFYDHWFEDAGVPDPTNPWANLKQATPERVRSAIGDVTNVKHERIGKYQEHIAETKDLIASMRKHFDLTPEEAARLADHEKAVDAAQDALARAVYFNLRTNQGKALLQSGGLGSGIGARVAAGYVVGGLPGAAIGTYAMNKLNPGASLYARSVIERMARQNEGRLSQGVAKLLTGAVPKIPSLGVAQTLSRLSRMADSEEGVKQDEYQRSVKEFMIAAQDPQKLELAIRQELGDVPEIMPNVVPNAVERVKRGLATALKAAPAMPMQTLMGEETSPVGDIELDVWERVSEAALDPSSIIDMAADGELIPEAVDAAEAVDPDLVSEIRLEVANQIDGFEGELSYERQLQVAILFKMPVDATTTPDYISTQQLMFAADKQKPKTDPRTFGETGVHETDNMSEADRLASGIPPT